MSKLIQRLTSNNKIQHFDGREITTENEQHALSLKEINWGFKAERKRYLIDPTTTIKQIWNFFIIFLVFYISITLPYEFGFKIPEYPKWYIIIGYIVDGFFTIDMFLNFFTTYQDSETHFFVNDYKKVIIKYLKSWFTIDFISIFPFEILAIGNKTWSIGTTWYKMLKCIRLLRITKVLKQMKTNKTSQISNIIRLGWMVILFCLVIHWMGCLFAATSTSWIQTYNLKTSSSKYIASLYWSAMTVTTVGYGDIVPQNDTERLINSIIMVFGSLIYAVIFGNISLYIANLNRDETQYQESVSTLLAHMKDISLPSKLMKKVLKYHDYVWQKNRGENNKNKLGDIPQRVQVEVAVLVHGRMIKLNPAFAQAPQSFINAAALSLRFTVCLPNEYVFQQGEIAQSIYFIGRGQVGIFRNKYGSITVLGASSFFGEVPLFLIKDNDDNNNDDKYIERDVVNNNITGSLLNMFRIHSVRGYAYCDLWKMDFEPFYELINSHPRLKTVILSVAKERIKKKRFYNDEVMLDKMARKMRSSLKRRQSKLIDNTLLFDDDDTHCDKEEEEKEELQQPLSSILSRLEQHVFNINEKINSIESRLRR